MLTCKQCGTQVEDGVQNCTNCGAPIEAPVEQANDSAAADLSAKLNELNNTADTTAEYDAQDIEKNKVMALLAYIIFLIPLFAAKDSKFARFHTNQGLVLFLAGIIASVVAVIPVIGWIVSSIAALAITVLAVIGILNALNGRAKELPVVGKFKILK
ncbi:MAG: zinc ribbon domain-containing protein [Clostridia bacterium]|nr:zinc ribbon domain-containing protein [Clostridia bacterium]